MEIHLNKENALKALSIPVLCVVGDYIRKDEK